MKKILTLALALAGAYSLQSCFSSDEEVYQQVYASEVFDVNANLTRANNYSQTFYFSEPSAYGDTVLVYIQWETANGERVWRLVPQTVQLGNGDTVTYNYDFTRNDFRIFLEANFDLNLMTDQEYSAIALNQIFRVVVVPGVVAKGTQAVDHSDYEATIKYYGLNDSNVKKLN